MSAEDTVSLLSEGQIVLHRTVSNSSSRDSLENPNKEQIQDADQSSKTTEPSSPKVHPMSFTIEFGDGKQVDKSRLEELAKKSKARHQRIQSMSAGSTRTSPVATKPPISVKLPRKAQGYNSEGYFSSDQEDSCLSGSVRLKQSPLAQSIDKKHITGFGAQQNFKSSLTDPIQFKRTSKSPIVDSIMSRSDILPSRQGLNLPLKNVNSSYLRDVHKTPSYGNLSSSYQPRSTMPDIINQSPEAVMLTDVSSPELDILTPDNGLSTPEHIPRSPLVRNVRAQSEIPEMLFQKCSPHDDTLFIDDEVDRESNNSSTGTYIIEGDNYTEEQKARMSIDRKLGMDMMTDSMKDNLKRGISAEKDPELIFDHPNVKESCKLRSPLTQQATFDIPSKVSKDKNVLEISCSYESPTENDLAAQTSKQIKSTRNYLEKIKNRVRTITEKTFSKHTEPDADLGNFTSVTTSGVLSTKNPLRLQFHNRRRCSLTKSEIDQTDYIHHLTRESSVPVSLNSKVPFEDAKFESTALRNAHKALRDDNGVSKPAEVVGKLSHLSINRCKGDKTWIQDWADSVKEYNNNTLAKEPIVNNFMVDADRLPPSPRWEVTSKCTSRNQNLPGTPTKIPSPHRMTPDLIPATQDTETYLQKTQNAITNLQAKLNTGRPNHTIPALLTSSLIADKTSRLPVSQLSRSNSLNYRLRRKPHSEANSPLRCPGSYVITGSGNVPESTKLLINTASRSLDERKKNVNSPERIALSNIITHTRHKSFDGKNLDCFTDNAKINNNEKIDLIRSHGDPKRHQRVFSDGIDKPKVVSNIAFGTSMRRSSSFNTVRQNNNYIDSGRMGIHDAYKKNILRTDLKSLAPANSPRCPNTPEMQRKFGPGLVRNSCRTNKERPANSRMSEPPMSRDERSKPANHNSRRVEPRQMASNRLTKSRSSTREFQPKIQERGKPTQHRSSSALAAKEQEFTNWKKRSTYDPMKAAQEGKRRQQARRTEPSKDDASSPSHSSPVHRSQSYHATNLLDLDTLDYSSEGTEEDPITLPVDNPMITSTHSDTLDVRRTDYRELRRQAMNNDIALTRDYTPGFRINQQTDTLKRRTDIDKRKTFILDDITPTKENVDFLKSDGVDKRRTFVLDSDTNSTTNGSSPRNSSIFSHEKNSLTICTSDTEGESGTESAPVVLRHTGGKRTNANPKHRYSGDYSMSSSTTSISQQPAARRKDIQPRYLDISKYKNDTSPKTFLRRDPSKTYVGVLPEPVSRGSAHQYELEQKKQELEKWKRRASYDPRKAAAQGRNKTPSKSASNVLRSQSFHGPMLASNSYRYQPSDQIVENYDASSDNDF